MSKKSATKKVTLKSVIAHNKELVSAILTYFRAVKYRSPQMQFHYNGTIAGAAKPGLDDKNEGKMSVGLANVQNLFHQVQTAQNLGYTVIVTAVDNGEQRVEFKVYKKPEIPEILRNLNGI
jgi:hypothetical protein